jgi:hypothetical protein
LLGLLQMKAQHDGEHIAEEMISVIESFGLVHKLGYFLTDNATNNDRAIRILGQKYGFDLEERRLRCLAHIINLAVHDLLDALSNSVLALSEADNANDNLASLHPLGKLHHIVTYVRATPQRREAYKRAAAMINHPYLMLTVDNETRWNSSLIMIQTAVKQRRVIDWFLTQQLDEQTQLPSAERKKLSEWQLSSKDWEDLVELEQVLAPFLMATKRCQGTLLYILHANYRKYGTF